MIPQVREPSLSPSHLSQLMSGAPTFLALQYFAFPSAPNADVLPGWGKNQLLCRSGCLGQLCWASPAHPFSHPSLIHSISLLFPSPFRGFSPLNQPSMCSGSLQMSGGTSEIFPSPELLECAVLKQLAAFAYIYMCVY